MRFSVASALEQLGQGEFKANVPDGWQQGRGAYGGLVLGTLARAMEAELADPTRRLRTLSGDLLAPAQVGAGHLSVRRLRHASNQTNSTCELQQSGQVVAVASAVFSKPRPSPSKPVNPPPPPPLDWTTLEPVPVGPPLAPVFANHFEFRTNGPFPMSDGADAITEGFVRAKDPEPLDAAAMVGLLDVWWPAFFSVEAAPRFSVTVSFVAQLLVEPASVPFDVPLRYRGRIAAEGEGFVVELRELWSGERLVATNQQTFAIVK